MGDRYFLGLPCAYCHKMNKDLYYAPSSNITSFICNKCRKKNVILMDFRAVREKHDCKKKVSKKK